ncbi:MAG: Gfo/Idh/MocA family oxidoreductase [Armatimonadetes bacterium]|nr:Gfo/Idh/MocA family oxidoreductase [Armatimonadota bacterium]
MKVALIGATQYARNHLACLRQMPGVAIVGIANRSLAPAAAAARDFGGKAFDNIEAMLDETRPDAVVICLIPGAHGEAERQVAARNLPFLVEKPVALDLETARAIEREVIARKLITAVGYQWRYLDLVERMRRHLAGARALLAEGFWLSKAPSSAWWNDPALSGGQLVEQATHMVDLARYLLGEPEAAHAVLAPPVPGRRVAAATALSLRFPGPVPAVITCACALPVRYRCGFVLHTEEAVLELMSVASGMANVVLTVKTAAGEEALRPGIDPIMAQDEAFVNAARSGDPAGIRCAYPDAVRTLALSLAAVRSAEDGVLAALE